jgi:hypothetical protein
MTSTASLIIIPEQVSLEHALCLTHMQGYKIKLSCSRLIAALIYSFLTLWCLVFHCENTYLLALRPTERLGLCNYGRPFFHVDCLLSPSFKLHLPFSISIFHRASLSVTFISRLIHSNLDVVEIKICVI